jgi:hypothetical protein
MRDERRRDRPSRLSKNGLINVHRELSCCSRLSKVSWCMYVCEYVCMYETCTFLRLTPAVSPPPLSVAGNFHRHRRRSSHMAILSASPFSIDHPAAAAPVC